MATTFVEYKGRSIHVPESILTITGYMLFHEGGANAKAPDEAARFERIARDFDDRLIGVGCNDLGLDGLLQGDPAKEREFLGLVRHVRARLSDFGDDIPAEYLEQFMPIKEYRSGLLVSPWFFKVLDVIEALITDEPVPDIWAE